ncbi:MAG: hypothetical protein KatS3mg129_2052 [Leptospiraceae bacterium]|nr:MAG: hypothetical protein KatS3mg129_2052 [Leptospiraceae bacterium]
MRFLLLFFLFMISIYAETIPFFPEILQTNQFNNSGIIFYSKNLHHQKIFYIIHSGKEGFYLKLENPLVLINQLFSIEGKCTVIEGKFSFYLLLKNYESNIIKIPININYLVENELLPYNIIFKEQTIIKFLKQHSRNLNQLLNVQIIGFLIIPYSKRTVFYCKEFLLKTKPFLLDIL